MGSQQSPEPSLLSACCTASRGLLSLGHCSLSFNKNKDDGKHKAAVCPVWCRGLRCRSMVLMFPFHRWDK